MLLDRPSPKADRCRELLIEHGDVMPTRQLADAAGCSTTVARRVIIAMGYKPTLSGKPSTKDAVYAQIEAGVQSPVDILRRLPHLTKSAINHATSDLEAFNKIVRVGFGRYVTASSLILGALEEHGPSKARALHLALGVPRSVVSDTLTDLSDAGRVIWSPGELASLPAAT